MHLWKTASQCFINAGNVPKCVKCLHINLTLFNGVKRQRNGLLLSCSLLPEEWLTLVVAGGQDRGVKVLPGSQTGVGAPRALPALG